MPIDVSLRIEGRSATLYEGPLRTDARSVDGGDGSGSHPCGAGRPSVLGALADAAGSRGFDWRATWKPDFQDFFIDRIGPDSSSAATASYWATLVDWRYTGGACTADLDPGAEILWAYDTGSRPLILSLAGPAHAEIGEALTVSVRDGWVRADTGLDGGPVAGARVGGVTTDAAGRAVLRFTEPGLKRLKAERGDAIRSNALDVCVGDVRCEGALPAPGGGPRGAALYISKISNGDRFARRRGPRILRGGTVASAVTLSLRRTAGERCSSWDATARRLRALGCGSAPLRFPARVSEGRWHRDLGATLPPGRYSLLALAGKDRQRLRFTIAAAPRTASVAADSARRYLIRAESPGGGFGSSPRSAPAALYTGWTAIGLRRSRLGPSGRRALRRARALLRSRALRPRTLADLERGVLALSGSPQRGDRAALRRWREAIVRHQRSDGSFAGQTNLTAYAVLALRSDAAYAGTARRARSWIARRQLSDGGFAAIPSAAIGDADTTGAVLWALGRGAWSRASKSAVRFLRRRQNPDGGFGALGGESNAQSTALAVLGLRAAGRDPRRMRTEDGISPLDHLRARVLRSGAIGYARGSSPTPVWSTSQALAALSDMP